MTSPAGEKILRGTIQVVHESETNRIAKDDDDIDIDDEDTEPIRLESCRVTLGCLDDDPSYRQFVQTFRFQDFEGLEDFLTPLRERILKRHPETLRVVHQTLQGIVQEIVNHHPDTRGRLGQLSKTGTKKDGGDFVVVAPFATPNVRLRPGGYATFLHADAIFPKTRNTSASSAMINVWIPLGKTPISNFPLCFYKCPRNETVFSENKLYYCGQERDNLCFTHAPGMQWGSFLCFVAGQPVSDDIVLLHGAVNLEEPHDYDRSSRINKKEPRQSIELRYLL
jgi:hypothetical protein